MAICRACQTFLADLSHLVGCYAGRHTLGYWFHLRHSRCRGVASPCSVCASADCVSLLPCGLGSEPLACRTPCLDALRKGPGPRLSASALIHHSIKKLCFPQLVCLIVALFLMPALETRLEVRLSSSSIIILVLCCVLGLKKMFNTSLHD